MQTTDKETLRRKADQQWEMAGLARKDNDLRAAAEHTRKAHEFEMQVHAKAATKPHSKDINTARKGVSLEHRHFAFIAATIASMKTMISEKDRTEVANQFAAECRRTNPRFDLDRFMAACQLTETR